MIHIHNNVLASQTETGETLLDTAHTARTTENFILLDCYPGTD